MFAIVLLALLVQDNQTFKMPEGVTIVRQFENPASKGVSLALPGGADFAPDGSLFVLDQRQAQVLIWNPDGSFRKAICQPGGKHDLRKPIKIAVNANAVWVWCRIRVVLTYSHDGAFRGGIRFPEIFPKSIGLMGPNLALMAGQKIDRDKLDMRIQLGMITGESEEIISFANTMMVDRQGDEMITNRAFGPDADVQRDEKGQWYFGFGDMPILFSVNKEGMITGQTPLPFPPDQMATQEEKDYLAKADFLVWSGHRIGMVDERSALNYKDPKSNFTQFTVKNGKAIFALTATGGYTTDLYAPNSRASYHVIDLGLGKLLSSGKYVLPKDTLVFYKHGSILMGIPDSTGKYHMAEISLKGW